MNESMVGSSCGAAAWLAVMMGAAPCFAGDPEPDADRYEPGALPVLAGDTDVGFKFGAYGQLARFQGGVHPYAWRVQAMAAASVMDGAQGAEFPYREVFLKADWPRTGIQSVRLVADASYARTTNRGYYGVGNASKAEPLWAGLEEGTDAYAQARRYYQFDATTPQVRVTAMVTAASAWQWVMDVSLRAAMMNADGGSRLAQDIAGGVGARQRLYGTEDYVLGVLSLGVVHDSRDHETVTTAGQWHEVSVRCVPLVWGTNPFCGGNITLRGYVPFAGERLSLAARLLGDVLTWRAPVTELSSYGGFPGGSSMGGSRAIRGVPQGRLHGRTKAIGNVELRSMLLPFGFAGQRFTLGAAAFADAGRVWTNPFGAEGELDGSGLGVHWGVGGGPRVRWGDSFLIRAELAHAPLGAEIGAPLAVYVDVEQVM